MDDLRTARRRQSYSQELLGDVIGLSQVSIANFESGRIVPRPEHRRRIEQVLGPIDWVRTRFGRPVSRDGEPATEDERILRELFDFIHLSGTPAGRCSRVAWCRQVIDHLGDGY